MPTLTGDSRAVTRSSAAGATSSTNTTTAQCVPRHGSCHSAAWPTTFVPTSTTRPSTSATSRPLGTARSCRRLSPSRSLSLARLAHRRPGCSATTTSSATQPAWHTRSTSCRSRATASARRACSRTKLWVSASLARHRPSCSACPAALTCIRVRSSACPSTPPSRSSTAKTQPSSVPTASASAAMAAALPCRGRRASTHRTASRAPESRGCLSLLTMQPTLATARKAWPARPSSSTSACSSYASSSVLAPATSAGLPSSRTRTRWHTSTAACSY